MTRAILIATSSASLRQTLQAHLNEAGYEVVEARDGQEALTRLQDTPGVSLLLTDLYLPLSDGLQLTRQVRGMPQYCFLPILVMTPEAALESEAEGLAAGVTGWFSQPFRPEQVLKIVNRLLA
jgi:two-component system, chemotaxis family, chemotaxis protein CheY